MEEAENIWRRIAEESFLIDTAEDEMEENTVLYQNLSRVFVGEEVEHVPSPLTYCVKTEQRERLSAYLRHAPPAIAKVQAFHTEAAAAHLSWLADSWQKYGTPDAQESCNAADYWARQRESAYQLWTTMLNSVTETLVVVGKLDLFGANRAVMLD